MFSFSQGGRGPGTASSEACFPAEGTQPSVIAGACVSTAAPLPDSDSRARVWAPRLRPRHRAKRQWAEATGCHPLACLQGQPGFFPPPIPWQLSPCLHDSALTQATGPHSVKTDQFGTSLLVQWLRLCTPYARALIQSLLRELDPICPC